MKTQPPFRLLPSLVSLLVALIFMLNATARGAESADSQIKGALDDVQRFERQFAGTASPNNATVNRTLKLLGLTRQRLDSSPNRTHESWRDADARLQTLVSRLQALASGSGKVTSPPTPGPSREAAHPESAASAPAPAEMISQYRVRLQKLIRDIQSATETLDQNGVAPFQSPEYIQKQLRAHDIFQQSLASCEEFAGDSDVVAAENALARFAAMISFPAKGVKPCFLISTSVGVKGRGVGDGSQAATGV